MAGAALEQYSRPAPPGGLDRDRLMLSSSRTDAVGIFPNEAAIIRLAGALLLEQNDEWQLQRRYSSLKACRAPVTISPLGCPPWSTEHESNHSRNHDSYTTRRDAIDACHVPGVIPASRLASLIASIHGSNLLSFSASSQFCHWQ